VLYFFMRMALRMKATAVHGIVCAVGPKLISPANQGIVMPAGLHLTTIGTFLASQNILSAAVDQCLRGDLNDGTANIAVGLKMLNSALLAELTQMSQDIAALKAEVDSLKPKPTALQRLSPRAPPVPWSAPR
jgi:hypothetical protein